eukprot:PhF_6_TR9168/c0_g3_i1/m.14263
MFAHSFNARKFSLAWILVIAIAMVCSYQKVGPVTPPVPLQDTTKIASLKNGSNEDSDEPLQHSTENEIHLIAFLDRNHTPTIQTNQMSQYALQGTCNFLYSAFLNGYRNISLFGYQTKVRRARETGSHLRGMMSHALKDRLDKLVIFAD